MIINYISGHESFYLREGWLEKGYKLFLKDKEFFSQSNIITAIDNLGVGANMVKSIKYWLEYYSVVIKSGKNQLINPDYEIIFNYDQYLQSYGSIWLLHLLSYKNSFPWQVMFQEEITRFTKEKIVNKLLVRLKENNRLYSERSIISLVNVFINSYLYNEKVENPEEDIISPLSKLKLIKSDSNKEFIFRSINANEISKWLIYFILFNENNHAHITIEDSYYIIKKLIKLDITEFKKIIREIEFEDLIVVDRSAGLNNIILKKRIDRSEIIKKIVKG